MDAVLMAKNLEERFLAADEKTGIPNVDGQSAGFADLPEDEFKEVELLIATVRDLSRRSADCAELVLRRGHDDKLKEMYGSESVDILTEAAASLASIADVLELLTGEGVDPVDAEPPAEEPKEEPKSEDEPKSDKPKEEPKQEPSASPDQQA